MQEEMEEGMRPSELYYEKSWFKCIVREGSW